MDRIMSKKNTILVLSIIGTLTGALMSGVAVSDTGPLVDVSKLIASDDPANDTRVWEQDIVISENGTYSLLVDEAVDSPAAGELSAVLIAGDRAFIQAENGVLSTGIELLAGNYKLYVSYSVPSSVPSITVTSTVMKGSSVYVTQTKELIRDSLDAGGESEELDQYQTNKLKIPVVPGEPIYVSLRGVNLGAAPDDMGVLVTTSSGAQTCKFKQSDFSDSNRAEVCTFSPDNDHIYIATYVDTGDMAVVVSVKTESEKLLTEQLLTGKQLVRLGEFTQDAPGQYVISLKDLQFPEAFNAVAVAAISADVTLSAESVAVSSTIKSVERTVDLGAGKYHVVAVTDLNETHSGTYSFSIMNGADSIYETVNTLGKHSIPPEPFKLDFASSIEVKLHDHEFPAKIDSLSVGIMTKDGMLPGGNSSVEHSLGAGQYYLTVAARSSRPGVYNLTATATDTTSVTPPGEGEVPPRGVSGSGGKKGGGGSVGAFFLLALGALGVYRRKFA